MLLKELREKVLEANLELVRRGLVLYTFGNASGVDRESGLVVIKPSGVDYDVLRAEDMVVVDLHGKTVEGTLKPSSDLDTHLLLYREFLSIGAVVHTHSEFATSFAQAGLPIPAFGTTHADYFHGPVPCTAPLSDDAIAGRYVHETGLAIVARFRGKEGGDAIDPVAVPACLVAGHAPFVWGRDAHDAAHNAVVLEAVARMAYRTLVLKADAAEVSQALLNRHYLRKHGAAATYGQHTEGKKLMAIAAGVDFGTLSVRVTLLDSERGRLGTASAEYPLHRRSEDPDYATQSHADQMNSLIAATRKVLDETGVDGQSVVAIALDTTGSSIIPVDASMQPLDEYYLWCDHRAHREAREITSLAHAENLEAIDWCGGVYSHEWGFAKLLHWFRNNPEKRSRFASAFEHCDMVAATLAGITDPKKVQRSICAMGHKWMWNARWGGLPPQAFLSKLDPLFDGIREKLDGDYFTSDHLAGHLSSKWAEALGLRPGIPIPVGAFDAHWDAIGAGCREGDVVNVVGTSTCIIAMAAQTELVPGVCGVVPGSVHPQFTGIEAGLSATGDIFGAIARRAGVKVRELAQGLEAYRAGQTGLLRLSWDNGDRTVLVNPELGGITFGWNLLHTAQDELFAAIEGTAFHTRIILERMAEHGVPVERVINAGGIPQNNRVLNQVYANVLNKPVLVPAGTPTSLGSGIFALLAAGAFKTLDEAQAAMCLPFETYTPDPESAAIYDELYAFYRAAYFALGSRDAEPASLGMILPGLRRIAFAGEQKL